jgi:hypothetical protein
MRLVVAMTACANALCPLLVLTACPPVRPPTARLAPSESSSVPVVVLEARTSAPTAASATAPLPSATPRPTAAPSAPAATKSPSAPSWRGDYCKSDADCDWNDPCVPTRCGSKPQLASSACDESFPPPGTCNCLENMCTLRPSDPSRGASEWSSCVQPEDCAVDVGTATCHPHGKSLIGPIYREGSLCMCRPGTGRCDFVWQQPVPCTSWRDCSWVRAPRLRPVPVQEAPRPIGRPVRPCVDGEVDSVCAGEGDRKACRIVAWGC